jgi:hypothetical protein
MFTRLPLHILLAVSLCVMSASAAYSQGESSGITGVVTWYGHARPETPEESKEFRPYRGKLQVKRASDSQTVAVTSTDAKGCFTVRLAPGNYFIGRMPLQQWHGILARNIIVEKDKFTHVKLHADNGMR